MPASSKEGAQRSFLNPIHRALGCLTEPSAAEQSLYYIQKGAIYGNPALNIPLRGLEGWSLNLAVWYRLDETKSSQPEELWAAEHVATFLSVRDSFDAVMRFYRWGRVDPRAEQPEEEEQGYWLQLRLHPSIQPLGSLPSSPEPQAYVETRLPAGYVTIPSLIRSLIKDAGITPFRGDDWEQELDLAEVEFRKEIRTVARILGRGPLPG